MSNTKTIKGKTIGILKADIDLNKYLDKTSTEDQSVKGRINFEAKIFVIAPTEDYQPIPKIILLNVVESIEEVINANKLDAVSKTTTEKQFIISDVNVEGKLQSTQKAELNVDVLRLEDGNDLYVHKTGKSIFDTLLGNDLSVGVLLNRSEITFGDNGKTAINKEYLEKVNAITISSAVSQSLNPNLLVENVDYTFTTSDKVRTITFTKSLMDYELFTYETFGSNAKNVNAQGIFKPNNNHYEDMLLNYKSTNTWYAIGVEWVPTNPKVMIFKTTDAQGWNGQNLVMYGRLR